VVVGGLAHDPASTSPGVGLARVAAAAAGRVARRR